MGVVIFLTDPYAAAWRSPIHVSTPLVRAISKTKEGKKQEVMKTKCGAVPEETRVAPRLGNGEIVILFIG